MITNDVKEKEKEKEKEKDKYKYEIYSTVTCVTVCRPHSARTTPRGR